MHPVRDGTTTERSNLERNCVGYTFLDDENANAFCILFRTECHNETNGDTSSSFSISSFQNERWRFSNIGGLFLYPRLPRFRTLTNDREISEDSTGILASFRKTTICPSIRTETWQSSHNQTTLCTRSNIQILCWFLGYQ